MNAKVPRLAAELIDARVTTRSLRPLQLGDYGFIVALTDNGVMIGKGTHKFDSSFPSGHGIILKASCSCHLHEEKIANIVISPSCLQMRQCRTLRFRFSNTAAAAPGNSTYLTKIVVY